MVELATAEKERTIRPLYVSYFFAAWGVRMWEFAAIVFLLDVFPGTLLPSSLFGFFESLAGILGGPHVGAFIDSNDRLRVIRTSILGQNIIIYLAAIVFHVALRQDQSTFPWNYRLLTLGIIVATGMVAKLASSMNKISIHKDWVVVLTSDSPDVRARVNAGMRRVDLSCSILAPMFVGALSTTIGSAATCLVIAGWSSCSLVIEIWIGIWVYDRDPRLHNKVPKVQPTNKGPKVVISFPERMRIFYAHRAFPVSLPYCLLYMSCLSFGGIMVSFLRTLGVKDIFLALGRGIAALVAIGATFVVPQMRKKIGLVLTAKYTIWSQALSLTPLVAAFVMFPAVHTDSNKIVFIVIVFATVCASRFGLWGFDLAQTQMMQDLVEPERAGAINGAQDTLINICWLVSYTFTMVFHDPRQFQYPVMMSYAAVLGAALLYSTFAAAHTDEDLRSWSKAPTVPVVTTATEHDNSVQKVLEKAAEDPSMEDVDPLTNLSIASVSSVANAKET